MPYNPALQATSHPAALPPRTAGATLARYMEQKGDASNQVRLLGVWVVFPSVNPLSVMSKSYEVANEQGDIVVRFNGAFVDRDALARLLDFVELESIRKRSQLTEEEATRLANEVDRSVWERVKHKYSTS